MINLEINKQIYMYIRHTVRCKKIGEKTREGKGVEEDEEEEEEEEKERVC